MYAPDDPFAVRRPARPVSEPGDGPGRDEGPTDEVADDPDIELLDRAEATFAGASEVIDLVERGDLDQAEALLDSLVAPSSE
jgi:hypothetical protein